MNRQQNFENNNEISLNDFYIVLKEYRKFIATFTILSSILSMLYSMMITPTYISQVKVMPTSQIMGMSGGNPWNSSLGALAGIGLSLGGSNDLEKYLAIFKSRKFIENFIEEEDLLPKLFKNDWDEGKKEWKDGENRTVRSGYGQYKKMLRVKNASGMWTISFESVDPEIASELANHAIKRINNYSRQKTIQETELSISYLTEQLLSTSVKDSQQFLYNLIEEETKKKMLANSREEFVFEVIDPSIVNKSIYYPIRNNFIIIGLLFGFLFSYGVVIIAELLSNSFPFLTKLFVLKKI